jgi:hypothetical protein
VKHGSIVPNGDRSGAETMLQDIGFDGSDPFGGVPESSAERAESLAAHVEDCDVLVRLGDESNRECRRSSTHIDDGVTRLRDRCHELERRFWSLLIPADLLRTATRPRFVPVGSPIHDAS